VRRILLIAVLAVAGFVLLAVIAGLGKGQVQITPQVASSHVNTQSRSYADGYAYGSTHRASARTSESLVCGASRFASTNVGLASQHRGNPVDWFAGFAAAGHAS